MRYHYDSNEDALYIRFSEVPYRESEEIRDGVIFDYDAKGKLIGIELLNASKKALFSPSSGLIRAKNPVA